MLVSEPLESLSATKLLSTKEAVFFIIGYCPGVSCIQTKKILRKEFNIDLTIQGVHKVLSELAQKSMILKNSSSYYANIEWIEQTKKNLNTIKERTISKEELIVIV